MIQNNVFPKNCSFRGFSENSLRQVKRLHKQILRLKVAWVLANKIIKVNNDQVDICLLLPNAIIPLAIMIHLQRKLLNPP